MSTGVAVARPPGGNALERELKYVIPAGTAQLARSVVAAWCRPDPRHPSAIVSTIYYDTPEFSLLFEKINSDYLKTKVRLRWYDASSPGAAHAFLEIKSRVGSLRRKARVGTGLEGRSLDAIGLDDPALSEVLELARPLGVALPARLTPVLLLRYERFRYVEPLSGARISVDSAIEGVKGNPQLMPHAFRTPLDVGVIEVKGREEDLPRVMAPLVRLGARRASFSKYGMAGVAMLRYRH
jgi:hypothetical protein